MKEVERNGDLDTELESVDGLPSLHVNLVVNGNQPSAKYATGLLKNIQTMLSMVKPILYEELLPRVQSLIGQAVTIDEVFVRRYGNDVGRPSISAHFDALSIATAVIALDDAAANGTNGLYTTSAPTSNHAALRRFFPLQRGDAVVHTWDVLHGVDVEPDVRRTSLIVWFAAVSETEDEGKASPWISNRITTTPPATDGVAEFVLASAIESALSSGQVNHQEHPHDLYLKSAASANAFAIDRLASLCLAESLTPERAVKAALLLRKMRPSWEEYPFHISQQEIASAVVPDGPVPYKFLSKLLWFEGSLLGLASSQLALGYALMDDAALATSQDLRLLAAVLFNLADQQGAEGAYNNLSEIVRIEVDSLSLKTNEEFLASPVVKTINSWR
jgi:hypothetical protein